MAGDSGATRFSKPHGCKAFFCDPCDRDQPRRFGVDALQQQWRDNFLDGQGPSLKREYYFKFHPRARTTAYPYGWQSFALAKGKQLLPTL